MLRMAHRKVPRGDRSGVSQLGLLGIRPSPGSPAKKGLAPMVSALSCLIASAAEIPREPYHSSAPAPGPACEHPAPFPESGTREKVVHSWGVHKCIQHGAHSCIHSNLML